jgi:bifunctional DNase/RNase
MDIEVRIRGLMMDPATNMPIIVLKDVASDTVMPIWVDSLRPRRYPMRSRN